MRSVALVVVNYKSAAFAIEAIRSAHAATSAAMQVIVVDNSVDAREADALRGFSDTLIVAERNLGYAAAINRASRKCDADVLIVANPDVVFGEQSIDRLLDVDGSVAGPALFWDDAYEWMLPPAELHTTSQVLDRAIASHSSAWTRMRDRRRIKQRIRFWSWMRPVAVDALSGSILAIRRDAFERAHGFDERYPLYFEENDFLRRVGGRIVYVPAARCRHLYNQSAGTSADAAAMYGQSEQAYLERWSGVAGRLFKRLEKTQSPPPAAPMPDVLDTPPGTLIEASPVADFETAAGHFPRAAQTAIPDSIWRTYRGPALYVRIIDRSSGSVLATYCRAKIAV